MEVKEASREKLEKLLLLPLSEKEKLRPINFRGLTLDDYDEFKDTFHQELRKTGVEQAVSEKVKPPKKQSKPKPLLKKVKVTEKKIESGDTDLPFSNSDMVMSAVLIALGFGLLVGFEFPVAPFLFWIPFILGCFWDSYQRVSNQRNSWLTTVSVWIVQTIFWIGSGASGFKDIIHLAKNSMLLDHIGKFEINYPFFLLLSLAISILMMSIVLKIKKNKE